MAIGQLRKQEEPVGMTKPYDIPKMLVWQAFQHVKANGGAAGIDRQSIEEFERNRSDNLYRIWNRMSSGSYFPPAVKCVPIPKKTGGTRKLGIPTVADRIAQTVVKMVLEPVLEPMFDDNSFGYRPGRSALDAITRIPTLACLSSQFYCDFEGSRPWHVYLANFIAILDDGAGGGSRPWHVYLANFIEILADGAGVRRARIAEAHRSIAHGQYDSASCGADSQLRWLGNQAADGSVGRHWHHAVDRKQLDV